MTLLFVVIAATVASVVLGRLVRAAALRHGAVVPPRSDRWHRDPTATLGGIAIATATLGVTAYGTFAAGLSPAAAAGLAVWLAALVMFLVWLADDWLQLSPLAKLVASLIIGAFFVFGVSARDPGTLPSIYTLLAVVWFGGVVHAVNLLDNMDGLAAGVGAIAAACLAWVFAFELGPTLVMLLAALAGALAGFLVWNRHPARLFMGDCGSLFIGATLAGASLVPVLQPAPPVLLDGFTAGLILVVPLFDTGFVLVLRRLAGRRATRGGTDHVSHRLASLGLSERSAVRVLYVLGALGGLTAYAVHASGGAAMLPLAVLFVVGVTLAGIYLARVRAYDAEDFRALQKSSFAPFLKDLAFKWHAGEVLLDLVLIAVVYYAAYRLRFEGTEDLETFLGTFTASLPMVLGCKLFALYVSGLYARPWATFGLADLFPVIRGVGLGSVLSVLAAAYIYRFEVFSRGVFLIDAGLLFLVITATRLSFQMMSQAAMSRSKRSRRVLIYGAGSGGRMLVREMRANTDWNLNPVGFLDDDRLKHKQWILGVPVRGGGAVLAEALGRYRVDEVILSSLSINGAREQQIRSVCGARGVSVRRLHLDIR